MMAGLEIAITGHRPKSLDNDYTYSSEIWQFVRSQLIETFVKVKPPRIYTGMALGVDTVAAEVALGLQIPYVACVPCYGQENAWTEQQKEHYYTLLEYAESEVIVTKDTYKPWYMQERNKYMVDHADLVVAVWNGVKGGTRNCVEYALRQQVPVWRIDPRTQKVGRYDGGKTISKQDLPTGPIREATLDS